MFTFLKSLNFSTIGPRKVFGDDWDMRRHVLFAISLKTLGRQKGFSRVAILSLASFLSSEAIHGQSQAEFIAGCAVGAFDSFPALKANCPPRTQEQVIDRRPAFTPQQLDEMNKYARDGATALQQYLNKQSISTVQPTVTGVDTKPSKTSNNQASDEVVIYQPSTLPSAPPSGGALTGVAKTASQYNQNASSRALANAQQELYEAERELAELTEYSKFVANQHAVMKAGLNGVSAALAAGAPLVKEGLTLAEAKALEKQMHLNPSRVHIFPADLEPFDSKGEIRMSHGMPVEYFRYTLVGDGDDRAKQDSVKPQGSQAETVN